MREPRSDPSRQGSRQACRCKSGIWPVSATIRLLLAPHRHPDKVPDERKAGAEERFKSINAACQKLTNKDADSDNSDFDMEESMEAAYAFFSFM